MKAFRFLTAAGLLAAASVIPAFGQGTATRPATTPVPRAATAPATTPATPIPDSKIAVVNTAAFGDEKAGITRFVAAAAALNRELDPKQKELEGLATRLRGIADEISKLNSSTAPVAPSVVQAKQEEGQRLQREIEFKQKEAQAFAEKRQRELLGPVYEDIAKALDAFAKARGITLLLDASRIAESIMSISPGMDITQEFIRDYNSRNPATASAAAPR